MTNPGTIICVVACFVFVGCSSAPRNYDTIAAYYRYDFTTAREALRRDAMTVHDEQTILNNFRLGIASLADGDLDEAELTLGKTFEFLSTAGLNKDRTIAAVFDHEGVRIWKGEPFEQALAYHYVATLYALRGDWENARAAAANSLFRLTDFGRDQNPESLTRRAAQDPDYLERGYTAVDTNFALGFLMQAIASDLSGAPGTDNLLEAATEINPKLESLAQTIRARDYNTLIIVDYGKGPTKIAYGPDDALARFDPRDRHYAPLLIHSRGNQLANVTPVCNVNQMAVDHRWNNLEDIRRAKSILGDALIFGGFVAAHHGSHKRDEGTTLAGIGAIAVGLLSKAGAHADTRHCEFLPQSIYLVPLSLSGISNLKFEISGDPASTFILPDVEPGSPSSPRTIYLRLHGTNHNSPHWFTARTHLYGNDHTGVQPGDRPWILGGHDVSTPSRTTLEAYQRHGYLREFTVTNLIELYQTEDIIIGSGMENRPDVPRNPSFRHVLEGGRGLFTPHPYSMGYKRLMYRDVHPYQPQTEAVRNISNEIRVTTNENTPQRRREHRNE